MEKAPNAKKLLLLGLVIGLVAAYFLFDLDAYLSLEYLKQSGDRLQHYLTAYPVASLAAFFSIYVLVTALSLPGAAVMTIAAGALFGLVTGVVLVSFASTLGATLAFVAARCLGGADGPSHQPGDRPPGANSDSANIGSLEPGQRTPA